MKAPLRIALLGSTGSIGRQTIDVALLHPQEVIIVALAANTNDGLLVQQARETGAEYAVLAEESAAARAAAELPGVDVGAGAQAVEDLAKLGVVDLVVNALVGAAGLRATLAALAAGKTLGLANKESLVVGGSLVTSMATPRQLIPIDSEHSAIHQCLLGEDPSEVAKIWITASGGPFRGRTRAELEAVTPAQALAHPTWAMGPKISIDSATLMNKGLEVIEAHHLFGVGYGRLKVVVHPQSCIHSMVEYVDGSVKAHLGVTDMRIPIQYALSRPHRWEAPVEPLDFTRLGNLEFEAPDTETFGCLALAYEAGRAGGTAPAALNAANEVAVAAFLDGKCAFTDIERTVREVLSGHETETLDSLEQVEAVDAQARQAARGVLGL
ncbi:MAG: 1-deoxy-D-xylulose-5-phosphate reductoisomerase [Actinobacteria bacterium HGW-Actinobacteria-9]|nr:MAG: 1-deoxy-D-xylulose-5-phosphate reductoisomerase [Actinobacteria bacterium HGW-Actinobacteria-9]